MNLITAIRTALEPTAFERKWNRMTIAERRELVCGSGDHGYFSRHDPEVEHIIHNEPAASVEMILQSRGALNEYLEGDTKPITDWSE